MIRFEYFGEPKNTFNRFGVELLLSSIEKWSFCLALPLSVMSELLAPAAAAVAAAVVLLFSALVSFWADPSLSTLPALLLEPALPPL